VRSDEAPRTAPHYLTASGRLHANWCGQLQRASYPMAVDDVAALEVEDWMAPCRVCLPDGWPRNQT
jgi:hypothetical protein